MSKLRFFVKNSHNIDRCFGQEFQDLFVLSMTGGRRQGTYLEIGAGDPVTANNTYLLTNNYEWNGVSIDLNHKFYDMWKQLRPQNHFISADALTLDYESLLNQYYPDNIIDYLQLDVDPAHNTLSCLTKLPHSQYRFRVITYETDAYLSGPEARNRSREIFQDLGYELVVGDILYANQHPYEDWYVDPKLVDPTPWRQLKMLSKYSQIPAQLLLIDYMARHLIG